MEAPQEHRSVHYHGSSPSQAPIYRLVRLRPVSESPSQFSSNFARELTFPPDTWQTRLDDPDAVMFVATSRLILEAEDSLDSKGWIYPSQFEASDQLHYGMICCMKSLEDPTGAFILSFWVAPSARRKGIGLKLVRMALAWARSDERGHLKFKAVLLDVQKDNMDARRLYEPCGFTNLSASADDPDELRYIYHL